MKAKIYILAFAWVWIYSSFVSAEELVESHRIYIENQKGGRIMVTRNAGVSWVEIGRVIVPVSRADADGFRASRWVPAGEIAATAINALHIKVGSPEKIFSILPSEFIKPPDYYNSYLSAGSAIQTDIKSSSLIFGGEFSPAVGDRVLVNGEEMKEDHLPKTGNRYTIISMRTKKYPEAIVFENKFAGRVKMRYADGSEKIVASVLRPVVGIGRFSGTQFLNAGRIRANHAGVIDISCSVRGKVGGFQIIPASHAESPEMKLARTMGQWMVVSAVEGKAPLFRGYLKPRYSEDDLAANNWEKKMLSHFLVDAKINGKWQPLPVYSMDPSEDLPPGANTFLEKVEEIRIWFPQ